MKLKLTQYQRIKEWASASQQPIHTIPNEAEIFAFFQINAVNLRNKIHGPRKCNYEAPSCLNVIYITETWGPITGLTLHNFQCRATNPLGRLSVMEVLASEHYSWSETPSLQFWSVGDIC